jgi:hypothetical protein
VRAWRSGEPGVHSLHIVFLDFSLRTDAFELDGETTMRTYMRDWIAWTLLAGIAIVVGVEYYVQQTTGMTTSEYVYKVVVTPSGER